MTKRTLANIAPWLGGIAIAAGLVLLLSAEVIGLHDAILATWAVLAKQVGGVRSLIQAVLLAGMVTGTVVCAIRTSRREIHFPPAKFLYIVVGGGFVLHVLLAMFVEPRWGTDYLRYWQHAQELVRRGVYGGFNGPYYSRALLVPYVVVRLFGPEATFALKLTNIFLLTACQLFVYDILRRVASHRAAQPAAILFVVAPLPAYATLIPSHDLWGMFFIATALWTLTIALFPTSTQLKPARWIPLALLAGVIAYLAELQRSTGKIFCLAMLLAALLTWLVTLRRGDVKPTRQRAVVAILVTILCLGTQIVANRFGGRLGMNPTPRVSLFMMKIAANGSGMGNGKSDWFARFRDRFRDKQSTPSVATDFAKSMALSSWSLQPLDRAAHLAKQSGRLFELSYPADWDWLMRQPKGMSSHGKALFVLYANFYGIALGAFFIYSLILAAASRRPPPLPVLGLLLTIAMLAFALLILFENKPYNIFPVWLAAFMTIGCVLAPSEPRECDSQETLPPDRRWLTIAEGGVAVAITAFVAIAIIRSSYGVAEGRLLDDWTFNNHQRLPTKDPDWVNKLLDARPEAFDAGAYDSSALAATYIRHSAGDGDRIRDYAGDIVTRLAFPAPVSRGDNLELATKVCTIDRRGLEFFLFSPAKEANPKGREFQLEVSVDGNALKSIPIPLAGKNFQRFVFKRAFQDGSCHALVFQLRADKAVGISNPPFVELWAPRTIP
jgi:hypothetical protein